jgi:hypothetical protein
MRYLKIFEDFKKNNEEGTLITKEDIINCIKKSGSVYATIVYNFPSNDPKKPLKPVDIDDDGLVTVEFDNKEYTIDLKNIEKIEF